MVPFEEGDVVPVSDSGILVVIKKQLVQLRRYLRGADPLEYREIPRMLAFFASVDEPYIHPIAVCIHPETSAVDKLLFFSASSAAMKNRDRRQLTFHAALPTPLSCE